MQKLGLAGLAICCIIVGIFFCRFEKRPILPKSTVNSCVQLRTELEQNFCSGTIAYDWGELSYYRQADSKISEPDSKLPRVVFVGDSITLAWPALNANAHFSGMEVINRGITGQLTSQMLLRFRQDVVDLHPQVVVILGGSNDLARVLPPALPVIESNLGSMAQLAKANGIRAVLSSLPPVSDYGHEENGDRSNQTKTHSPQQIRELNNWIKTFATQNDCIYLDYYSAMVDREGFLRSEYSEDGLHPNAAGYAVMEPLAAQAVKDAIH